MRPYAHPKDGSDVAEPAGWYQDPLGQPLFRWWDGEKWGAATKALPAPAGSGPVAPATASTSAATRVDPATPAVSGPSGAAANAAGGSDDENDPSISGAMVAAYGFDFVAFLCLTLFGPWIAGIVAVVAGIIGSVAVVVAVQRRSGVVAAWVSIAVAALILVIVVVWTAIVASTAVSQFAP